MSEVKTITLDAGHYGDKYNQSPVNKSYYESNITWQMVESLAPKLESRGFKVIKTRSDKSKDMNLLERGRKSKNTDLFLSLHTNACDTESVDRVVPIVFSDNKTTNIDDISREIGDRLGKAVKDTMGVSTYKVTTKKSANDRDGNGKLDDEYYGVLEGARQVGTPGIILECGFHTNKKTADWLLQPSNIEKLTDSIAETLAVYFNMQNNNNSNESNIVETPTQPSTEDFGVDNMFDFFVSKGLTHEGAAGLLGNYQSESALSPINLQNSYEKKLGMDDATYTLAVDTGAYGNFIKDSAGYGLAQWTYWSRKQGLYEYATTHNSKSIGDRLSQCEYTIEELKKDFKSVYTVLTTTNDVTDASNAVLMKYEKPAVVVNNKEDSEAVKTEKAKRLQNSLNIYNKYYQKQQETPKEPKVEEVKDEGKLTESPFATSTTLPKTIKVLNSKTPVFKGVEFNSAIVMTVNENEIYTVVEEINNLYKLKSGVGYIRKQDVKDYDISTERNPYKVPTQTLKYGMNGEEGVKWLKFELLRYGIGNFNHTNGNFYDSTLQAVKQYQQIMGLEVDGIVGDKTRNCLINDGF